MRPAVTGSVIRPTWLRQNDHERAVGMVQAGITHQAVADHFNVYRITISRLMIRLRQTGRTNDRPGNGGSHVTSQRQDRHIRLIHPRNRMITAADTARRTPDEPRDILHCHVERRNQSFAVIERAERYHQDYSLCILRHSMFLEQV
jgi:hypothetical protein